MRVFGFLPFFAACAMQPVIVTPPLATATWAATATATSADTSTSTSGEGPRAPATPVPPGPPDTTTPIPAIPVKGTPADRAVAALNRLRADAHLPPVALSANLSLRCERWAAHMMATQRLAHDGSVYGTQEREVIAENTPANITPEWSLELWAASPPHRAELLDDKWPQAATAGYGQVANFSCMRLCPAATQPSGICTPDVLLGSEF